MTAAVLELSNIDKRFANVAALQDVSLRLRAGEVHALMGQNGAGKSTLIKVLTGVYAPDAGRMTLEGRRIGPATPLAAQRLGISTVYQELNLCPNLSVAENIYAGRYPRHGWRGLRRINWRAMQRDAAALLARLNIDVDVTRPLGRYSVAVRQTVAIARALAVRARVLILDEPTASLDEDEVERLFVLLRRLRDEGLAILFVTHFLDQVYAISDRITVLRNGKLVGEWPTAELPAPALVAAMVGREVTLAASSNRGAADTNAERAPRLQAQALGARQRVHPTDLSLYGGEVVGVAGLLGSGRTELARLLFALDRPDGGELRFDGQAVRLTHPAQAVRLGIAFCPEDRKVEGIVADLSVGENIVLALQARQGVWRHLSPRSQREIAERYIRLLGIKTAHADVPIGQLSGGNQQKAVLARWLAIEPQVLILDEPTCGIDVAAKQEIMNEVLRLARAGMAVLFISSEIDEVTRVADRIVVMRDRRKVGELAGGTDEHTVMSVIAAGT
jgi:simple sugar transport system ATP-binding protein